MSKGDKYYGKIKRAGREGASWARETGNTLSPKVGACLMYLRNHKGSQYGWSCEKRERGR